MAEANSRGFGPHPAVCGEPLKSLKQGKEQQGHLKLISAVLVDGGFEGDEMAAGDWVEAFTALEATPAPQPRGASAFIKYVLNMQELS